MKSHMRSVSTAFVVIGLAIAGSIGPAQAENGPWQVRLRALHLDTANKSDPIGGTGPANQVSVSSKTIPEIDISYFFTPNLAAELVLTVPQRHDVSLSGAPIGSFKHLPPSLLLQYHFAPDANLRPYVGAGVNVTRISSVKLLGGAGDLETSSIGPVLQAGVDLRLTRNWSLNFDVKKIRIRSDVEVNGSKVTSLKVDPLLFGVGLGYRF